MNIWSSIFDADFFANFIFNKTREFTKTTNQDTRSIPVPLILPWARDCFHSKLFFMLPTINWLLTFHFLGSQLEGLRRDRGMSAKINCFEVFAGMVNLLFKVFTALVLNAVQAVNDWSAFDSDSWRVNSFPGRKEKHQHYMTGCNMRHWCRLAQSNSFFWY